MDRKYKCTSLGIAALELYRPRKITWQDVFQVKARKKRPGSMGSYSRRLKIANIECKKVMFLGQEFSGWARARLQASGIVVGLCANPVGFRLPTAGQWSVGEVPERMREKPLSEAEQRWLAYLAKIRN